MRLTLKVLLLRGRSTAAVFRFFSRFLSCIFGLALTGVSAAAADRVFPYSAFGPQVVAHELIGMEWWQWQDHGDSRPRHYPIKVVVYWGQSEAETKKKYPVIPEKEQDYRYVSLRGAVEHLQRAVRELKNSDLDATPLRKTLRTLTAIQTR